MGDPLPRRRRAARPRRHEQTTYDLARTACQFSQRMRDVIDDKLGFAAALIRAGELDAACRLFAELDGYVKGERAALGDGLEWDEEPA
ncbi:MAG: hypothetical protein M3214_12360 [Actinomycetota bacterium]|nr:hypothetical protein [Actinomycetota bacterium]